MPAAEAFIQIEPRIKEQAEAVLHRLGLSLSGVVNLFLRQIVAHESVSFEMEPPRPPLSLDTMTQEEINAELQKAWGSFEAGDFVTEEELDAEFARDFGI